MLRYLTAGIINIPDIITGKKKLTGTLATPNPLCAYFGTL